VPVEAGADARLRCDEHGQPNSFAAALAMSR
jgi:hypothetical protein